MFLTLVLITLKGWPMIIQNGRLNFQKWLSNNFATKHRIHVLHLKWFCKMKWGLFLIICAITWRFYILRSRISLKKIFWSMYFNHVKVLLNGLVILFNILSTHWAWKRIKFCLSNTPTLHWFEFNTSLIDGILIVLPYELASWNNQI